MLCRKFGILYDYKNVWSKSEMSYINFVVSLLYNIIIAVCSKILFINVTREYNLF